MGDDRFVPESDPLEQYGHGAPRLSRSRRRAGAPTSIRSRPMPPIRKPRRGSTKTSSRSSTAPIGSIRRGRYSISSDGTRRRRPHRVAVSARACTRGKKALGGRRRQSRHGALRAARHVDVSRARLDAAKCCFWSTAPTSALSCKRVLAGDDLPAHRAYSDGDLVWLIDRAAAPEN